MANATADATQARLQQLSAAQSARRSAESADQRLALLLQISAAQTKRSAAETVAETETRFDRDREAQKGIEDNVACSRNLHCLNSLWFVTKGVPSIDTYLNWRWRNVSLAVRHFLDCSYNLCSLLSVCDVIALFLAQARPTDDYHLPSCTMKVTKLSDYTFILSGTLYRFLWRS